MNKLKYEFICHYNDGLKAYQQYGTGKELHFGNIDQEKLVKFELASKEKSVSVNLRTGEFLLNDATLHFEYLPKTTYNLVYFRRVRETAFPDGHIKRKLVYCLGIECNYEDKNYQALVWIDENTDIISIGKRK